jgi:hypothetical protein
MCATLHRSIFFVNKNQWNRTSEESRLLAPRLAKPFETQGFAAPAGLKEFCQTRGA